MQARDIIDQARQSFDKILHSDTYPKIHADASHLDALLALVEIQPQKHYLDLGTGNGYIAFELASRYPSLSVTGLDIATNSIQINQDLQRKQGLANLCFHAYDGFAFPFENCSFWGVISRYAFHHFPNAVLTIQELHRITEEQGFVIISDPITHNDDTVNFIDQFQQIRPDGHVHFYRPQDLEALFRKHGFEKRQLFMSTITYPRELDAAYLRLLNEMPVSVLEKYRVEVGEKTVQVTVEVMNVLYRKNLNVHREKSA